MGVVLVGVGVVRVGVGVGVGVGRVGEGVERVGEALELVEPDGVGEGSLPEDEAQIAPPTKPISAARITPPMTQPLMERLGPSS